MLKCKNIEIYNYIIGPLLAYYFYELDKIDPEIAKYKLDYFYLNIDKYNPIELLEKSNIDVEGFTNGDIAKRLIKKYNDECAEFKS